MAQPYNDMALASSIAPRNGRPSLNGDMFQGQQQFAAPNMPIKPEWSEPKRPDATQAFLNSVLGSYTGAFGGQDPLASMKAAGATSIDNNPPTFEQPGDSYYSQPHGPTTQPKSVFDGMGGVDPQQFNKRAPNPELPPQSSAMPGADPAMDPKNMATQALLNSILDVQNKMRSGDPDMKARADAIANPDMTHDPIVGGIEQRRQLEADLMGMKHQAGMEIAGMGLPATGGERGVNTGSLAARPNISTGEISSGNSLIKQMMDADQKELIDAGSAASNQRGADMMAAVPGAPNASRAWMAQRGKTMPETQQGWMGAKRGQQDSFNQVGLQNRTANRQTQEASANAQLRDNAAQQATERRGRMAGLGSQNAYLNAQQQALINGVMDEGGGDIGNLLALQGDPRMAIEQQRQQANMAGIANDPQVIVAKQQEELALAQEAATRNGTNPQDELRKIRGGGMQQGQPAAITPIEPNQNEMGQIEEALKVTIPYGNEGFGIGNVVNPAGSLARTLIDAGMERTEEKFIELMRPAMATNPRLTEDYLRKFYRSKVAASRI